MWVESDVKWTCDAEASEGSASCTRLRFSLSLFVLCFLTFSFFFHNTGIEILYPPLIYSHYFSLNILTAFLGFSLTLYFIFLCIRSLFGCKLGSLCKSNVYFIHPLFVFSTFLTIFSSSQVSKGVFLCVFVNYTTQESNSGVVEKLLYAEEIKKELNYNYIMN